MIAQSASPAPATESMVAHNKSSRYDLLEMRLLLAVLVLGVGTFAESIPPQLLSEKNIEYTESARIAHIEGSVGVTCDVDRRGKPVNVRITKSLEASLDRHVMEAVAHWQFRPGVRNGKNIAWKNVSFEIPFVLPKEPSTSPDLPTVLACVIIVCGIFVMIVLWVERSRKKSSLTPPPPQAPSPTQALALTRVAPTAGRITHTAVSRTATATAVQTAPYIVPARLNLHKQVPRQYVVVDLETTGLTAARCDIIEIGAILVDREASTEHFFQTLVLPTKRIPPHITQINGITQAMVNRSGLPVDRAMREFLAFAGDLPLIAYNASFDMGFLGVAAERCNLAVRNQYTCAMKMARRAWPTLENHKLGTVSSALNFRSDDEDEGAHRAVGDCRRTVHIYHAAAKALGLRFL